MRSMRKLRVLAIVVGAIVVLSAGFAAATVSPARAAAVLMQTIGIKAKNPSPTCPAPFVFSGRKAKCIPCPKGTKYEAGKCKATSTPVVVVEKISEVAQVSSLSKGQTRITVLAYENAKGMPKAVVKKLKAQGKCSWIGDGTDTPTYWNSGLNAHGVRFWFLDHRHVYQCGHRKVKCKNLLRFTRPKKNVVTGIVVMLRAFGRFHGTFVAHTKAEAHGTCGSAFAEARGTATLSGSTRMQARGNARLLASVRATLSASATAKAQVVCTTPPTVTITTPTGTTTVTQTVTQPTTTTVHTTTTVPTTTVVTTTTTPTTTTTQTTTAPPPVHHSTQISCQFPPHIIAGNSQFVYCVATNDNGALISPSMASSNDSLLRASELKSVAQRNQAGDPCPSGAQCFRWTLYAGSGTGFATLTATAKSNGTSDSTSGTTEVVSSDTGFGN